MGMLRAAIFLYTIKYDILHVYQLNQLRGLHWLTSMMPVFYFVTWTLTPASTSQIIYFFIKTNKRTANHVTQAFNSDLQDVIKYLILIEYASGNQEIIRMVRCLNKFGTFKGKSFQCQKSFQNIIFFFNSKSML